ncbi:MAG: transposase [Sulfobacillus acidophilus]|uniref:Transposase n=1 Tax=Sulfobacillus acidophilus TaxID=53633 RepID=A0A2T2WI43_9FIRM|nr:MAG: transposase [Sulfobacillus acidophilus]
MKLTLTAKVQLYPTAAQTVLLQQTVEAYRQGCNWVSGIVETTHCLQQADLHTEVYRPLRAQFGLRSQMAQSVIKTVIARYKSVLANGHPWTRVQFNKPALDLVWNRDYSLKARGFSLNTLAGRVQVPFAHQGMERFFNGAWQFGTAHLVHRHGRWFLYVPMTQEVVQPDWTAIRQVVGLDFGINFLVTAYDSQGQTTFFSGRAVKARRAHFKILRQTLQRRQTPSARRRLKRLGQREHRWMTAVNHQVSKALVARYGAQTLFVVEDLTGMRGATERVRRRDRYTSVSWAFYQLRQMLEYKAALHQARTVAVDPRYTSQTCPKCGHVAHGNRDKRRHRFECQQCHYRSNDDRIGAMNLHRQGIEYRVTGAIAAGPRS